MAKAEIGARQDAGPFLLAKTRSPNVRYWHLADVDFDAPNVRFEG